MANGIAFFRCILFCMFFSIGAGTIAVSMLIHPEVSKYYQNISQLNQIDQGNKKIEKLITQYDAQIEQIEKDPNLLSKLKTITFGDEPALDGAVMPKASNEQLAQAKEALLHDLQVKDNKPIIPIWVQRCREARSRRILFTSGCALILTAFIFFGTPRHYKPRRRTTKPADSPGRG
jgi:hypothetical protein